MKLDIKEYEEKMKKTVGVYKTDLDGVRVGRANTAVLQKVFVDYYGSPTPIMLPRLRLLTRERLLFNRGILKCSRKSVRLFRHRISELHL